MMRIIVGFPYMIHHDRTSTLITCPEDAHILSYGGLNYIADT